VSQRLSTSGRHSAGARDPYIAGAHSRQAPVVLVTTVAAASGARAAAAALACAAAESDRAALLVDLGGGRPPRPSLIATAGARALEERLGAHLPGARIASRGQICQLTLPPEPEAIERIAAATPLARESAAVIHLPPSLVRPALDEPRIRATAALLRADLAEARALTCLAVRDLIAQRLSVVVQKHPLPWFVDRMALLGVTLPGGAFLPPRAVDRLLSTHGPRDSRDACYRRQ
jgi:hypothetical protein